MNKNGWTLIELLLTITLLALIMTIATISYQYIFNKVDEKYYQTLEESLLLAGNTYFHEHRSNLMVNEINIVSLEDLVNGNYIDNIKDSKGNVCSKSFAYAYYQDNQFNYGACIKCLDYETESDFCK